MDLHINTLWTDWFSNREQIYTFTHCELTGFLTDDRFDLNVNEQWSALQMMYWCRNTSMWLSIDNGTSGQIWPCWTLFNRMDRLTTKSLWIFYFLIVWVNVLVVVLPEAIFVPWQLQIFLYKTEVILNQRDRNRELSCLEGIDRGERK